VVASRHDRRVPVDEDERHEDFALEGEDVVDAVPFCERCGLAVLAHVTCPACGDPYAFDDLRERA
jgi:ribosomal protein S27AE